MSQAPSGRRCGRIVLGWLTVAIGLALLSLVAAATYGESGVFQRLSLRLGLGGSTLLAAIAETVLVAGGWLLWAARGPAD